MPLNRSQAQMCFYLRSFLKSLFLGVSKNGAVPHFAFVPGGFLVVQMQVHTRHLQYMVEALYLVIPINTCGAEHIDHDSGPEQRGIAQGKSEEYAHQLLILLL